MNNLAKRISIVAGVITAITLAYSGLAPVWNLPLATEIQQTGAVLVVLLSGILSAFTGQKIITNRSDQREAEALIEENTKMAETGVFKGITSSTELSIKTPNDLAEKHADFEAEGGQGAVYSVDVSSYDAFRNNVINKGYDIDNYYGFQCWDGAALLWQQLWRDLSTGGTGAAKGCWTHARDKNAGSDFDLVTSQANLRRGDIVVFGGGQYGHIAFVDRINGDGTINVLGQNQNGGLNGSPFNIIRMSLGNFLGAFRFKNWNVEQPVTPQPTPPQYKPVTEDVVNAVLRGDYGNGEERKTNLTNAGYNYEEVQNDVNSALNVTSDVSGTPQIGDRVTTSATVDQNGVFLNLAIINDGNSVFSEVNSRGYAVLKKDNIVRCAVPIGSLRKV
jgi:surface antigen